MPGTGLRDDKGAGHVDGGLTESRGNAPVPRKQCPDVRTHKRNGGQAARVPEDERFERVFDDMEAHEAPRQKVFFEGQVFDAFELLVWLVQHAKESIVLIDGHADADTLNTLAKKNGGVAFTL